MCDIMYINILTGIQETSDCANVPIVNGIVDRENRKITSTTYHDSSSCNYKDIYNTAADLDENWNMVNGSYVGSVYNGQFVADRVSTFG